jgi:hypothetical protein
MLRFVVCLILLLVRVGSVQAADFDVVIYGGTSAGVIAAVQVSRMGKSVVLLEPKQQIGGLTISGLGFTDTGDKRVIGGLAREFYQRVKRHYDSEAVWKQEPRDKYDRYHSTDDAMWTFEPHVARAIFLSMLHEAQVPVVTGISLGRSSVTKANGRLTSIRLTNGETYRGKVFIDASYEGDLMASAGVSFTVGREANAHYGEKLNGVQVANAKHHQFIKNVDPYLIPGDKASGLLPQIRANGPGVDGAADELLQAYNFRLCLTDDKANQTPFVKPEGYNEREYELLLRNCEAGDPRHPWHFGMMPNRKTDMNNNFAVSSDYIGANYDYANADDGTRAKILKAHETYLRGFMWTLANHPRVSEPIQREIRRWGYASDEFTDNNLWPYWCYIREARRMVANTVHTELDCRRQRPCPDPVGMGSYNMDSHNCQRYVNAEGFVRNEGDVQVSPGGPYLISYRTLTPKPGQADNLLVPVCLSCTHIAYGSIRMEPVFMILGQSAATAASIAIDDNVTVQQVEYAKLRARLDADKQALTIPPGSVAAEGIPLAKLAGLVVDDAEAKKTGTWVESQSTRPFVGAGYLHDNNERDQPKSIQFDLPVKAARTAELRLAYSAGPNRATNVRVKVQHAGGETVLSINQKKTAPIDGLWISLGKYELAPGQASILIESSGADGHVIADAIQALEP